MLQILPSEGAVLARSFLMNLVYVIHQSVQVNTNVTVPGQQDRILF